MKGRYRAKHVLWLLSLVMLAGCTAANAAPAGPLPTASAQDLRLTADKTTYTTHTPIGISLANVGQVAYYGLDGRSGCTLVQVQRFDADHKQWVSVDGCTPAQPTHVLQIPVGAHEPFTLTPSSSADPNAWQPGLYRAATAFSPNLDGISAERVAYSAGFVVHD